MIAKNTAKVIEFHTINTDGTANTTATPTCEVAGDTGDFAACANAPVRKKSSTGADTCVFHITLAQAEMNYDLVTFRATATGCVPYDIAFYTESTYTATKAGYLDAEITSRLASAGYTAPDNTGIGNAVTQATTAATQATTAATQSTTAATQATTAATNTTNLPALIENVGGQRFKAKALETAPTTETTGTGAHTVTVTTSPPLAGVSIALYVNEDESDNPVWGLTGEDGMIQLKRDGTAEVPRTYYRVVRDIPGYLPVEKTTVTVNGVAVEETVTLTAQTPTPGSSNTSTGSVTTYGNDGELESGVVITCWMNNANGTGVSHSAESFTITSGDGTPDPNGIASGTFFRGCAYSAKRGTGNPVPFTVPDAATFDLPAILGRP